MKTNIFRDEKGRFKKGLIPWNRDLKGIHLSPKSEFKRGMKPWNAGKKGYTNNKKSNGYINTAGYFSFYKKGKEFLEHRLIWEKHNGQIPNGYIVHHKDGNKLNNNILNLQLVTRAEHSKIHNFVEIMRKAK